MQFRTLPTAFEAVGKQTVIQMSVITLLVVGVVIVPGFFSNDPSTRQSTLLAALVFIAIFLVTTVTQLKKNREKYLSVVITIEEDSVIKEMTGMPTLKIKSGDIVKIIRGRNQSIYVCGTKRTDQLLIPSQMENYDEMVAALATFKPITENRRNYSYIPILTLLVVGALMAGDFVIKDRLINIISYSTTILMIAASIILAQWSPLVEKRLKRISWFALIPLVALLSILINLIRE